MVSWILYVGRGGVCMVCTVSCGVILHWRGGDVCVVVMKYCVYVVVLR